MADPILVRRYRRASGYRAPIPRRMLRTRVGEPDIRHFVEHGLVVTDALMEAAEAAGQSLVESESVLDFGCGCGRNLIALAADRGRRPGLFGCDVDEEAIAWLQNVTEGSARCVVNGFSPPLPFADEAFDLVYSVSILTHLDERFQHLWLADIDRVLRPGGIAMISVHGEHAYDVTRSGDHLAAVSPRMLDGLRARGPLREERFVFLEYERRPADSARFPGIAGSYGLSFQHPDQVVDRWSERFTILDHRLRAINHWQDLVVLRKRVSDDVRPRESVS